MEAAGGGSYRFLKRDRGRILLFFCLGTGTVWKQTVPFFVLLSKKREDNHHVISDLQRKRCLSVLILKYAVKKRLQ